MPSRLQIKDVNYIAEIRGGKCLSKEYINGESPLKWRCEKGHTWDASYRVIEQGGWCVQCIREHDKIRLLNKYQKLAESRNGKCLSKKYENKNINLKWQCDKGHTWMARSSHVLKGNWCVLCKREQDKILWLNKFQKLAEEKNGKCMSPKYVDKHFQLQWQCDKGHTWMGRPTDILRGSWCPKCTKIQAGLDRRMTITQLKALAKSHGGKYISGTYLSTHSKLEWQCKKGHRWRRSTRDVKRGGWCKTCAGIKTYSIEDMKLIAQKKGGKCLSIKYINGYTKLKWQCSKGHEWESAPANIIRARSTWCPVCAKAPKYTISDMQVLAQKREGKCLSKDYRNFDEKLKWQCKYGHKWEARFHDILLNNSWCPVCAIDKRRPYFAKSLQKVTTDSKQK